MQPTVQSADEGRSEDRTKLGANGGDLRIWTPENAHRSVSLLNEIVVGIDPGNLTGIVKLEKDCCTSQTLEYSDVIELFFRLHLKRNQMIYLVAESFINRTATFVMNQKGPNVLGAMDFLHRLNPNSRVNYQSPQVMKTMTPEPKVLKSLGWTCASKHEWDALRHALYYVVTR